MNLFLTNRIYPQDQAGHISIIALKSCHAPDDLSLQILIVQSKEIAQLGYKSEFGARPLKRAIQQHIIVPLSQYRLTHPQEQKIKIGWKNDKVVVKSASEN